MIYNSLKIGPSGGIIANLERVHQDPHAVTIAIGIGGTGVSALKTFKNEVYSRLIQDNAEFPDDEPKYDRIKFLAIDSDESSCSGVGYSQIERSEFFQISVNNIGDILANKSRLEDDRTLQWFNYENIDAQTAMRGACGVRQIGRFLIIKRAGELKARLEQMIRVATTGVKNADIYIHIFAGISGGTGSGCFIDTCYIVQEALRNCNQFGAANIMGFFFLPDVTINSPSFPQNDPNTAYVKENGYAAMKELDYLMNLKDGGAEFEQDYGSFRIKTDMPPVQECHLISTTLIDGTLPNNAYNYIMNAVSEYALNYMVKYTGTDSQGASNNLDLKGLIANLIQLRLQVSKTHGANYRYNLMGASSAIIPYREIATYLATGLFDYFDYYDKKPSEADVRNFAALTGITFGDLTKEITKGMLPLNLPDIPAADLKAGNAPLVGRTNEWLDRASGVMEEAYTKLSRDLGNGNWDVSNAPDSIMGKIYKMLLSYVTDPTKGPFYASAVLKHDDRFAFDNYLEGLLKEVRERIHTETIQKPLRDDELNKAKSEFLSTGSLNPMLNSRKKKYVSEHILSVQHYHNMERLSKLEDLITNIRTKVNNLYNDFFVPLTSVLTDLRETFAENKMLFAADLHHGADKQYLWNIVELNNIKDTLDAEIKKTLTRDNQGNVSAAQAMYDFLMIMTQPSNIQAWMTGRETMIANLISKFIRDKFKSAIDKSMITYLRDKYNADGTRLVSLIADNVIGKGIVDNATPAFFADNTIFNESQVPIQCVMSIPQNESIIKLAAEKYKNDNGNSISIRETDIQDRISMLWFYTGVPIYAYKMLMAIEEHYTTANTPGAHLYEKGDVNWRRMLSSPMPATHIVDSYEPRRPDRERIDKVTKYFKYAEDKGLIINKGSLDNPSYYLPVITAPDFESVKKLATGSADGRAEAAVQMKQFKTDVAAATELMSIAVPSNVNKGDYPNAMIDVIVKYPKLRDILYTLVDAYAEADRIISECSRVSAEDRSKYMKQFRQALYAGVVRRNRTKYVYKYEERGGFEADYNFTDAGKPYNEVPVYQAATAFAEMDNDDMRQDVVNKTMEVLNGDITDEIFENAQKLLEYFDKERMKEYHDEIAKFGEAKEEAEDFLVDFFEGLRRFIRDNE